MAAAGCHRCRHTGYDGRAALFEICMVSPRLQDLIIQASTESVLHALAIEEGMIPLRHNGWAKVFAGETTIEEVVRVTAAELEIAAA
jgi:type II secretory ATPase GspE/PulE/Tfp pilus assembly ATPase PilB-like protein